MNLHPHMEWLESTSVSISIHESISDRPVLLKGPAVPVDWVSPQTWVHIEGAKEDGD